MTLEIVHTERSYIVMDSESWQQPSLVRITRQLQAKLANARVARDALTAELSQAQIDKELAQQSNLFAMLDITTLRTELSDVRTARDARLGALITTEGIAKLLLTLAGDSESWAQDNNSYSEEAVQARALAAHITGALVQEGHK